MCHKGRISSLTRDEKDVEIFTIDGPSVSNYPASPIFTYDKTNKTLHLIGVIPSQEKKETDSINQAVHINLFKNELKLDEDDLGETRGVIQVHHENFKGMEIRSGGPGSRYIKISGNSIQVTYKLIFLSSNGKTQNPHADPNYNKNQEGLYHAALKAFVSSYDQNNQQVLDRIPFDFAKSEYLAQKE